MRQLTTTTEAHTGRAILTSLPPGTDGSEMHETESSTTRTRLQRVAQCQRGCAGLNPRHRQLIVATAASAL